MRACVPTCVYMCVEELLYALCVCCNNILFISIMVLIPLSNISIVLFVFVSFCSVLGFECTPAEFRFNYLIRQPIHYSKVLPNRT